MAGCAPYELAIEYCRGATNTHRRSHEGGVRNYAGSIGARRARCQWVWAMTSTMSVGRSTGGIDLVLLLVSLRQRWHVIAACAAVGLLIAVVHLRSATYFYTAELKVTAVSKSGQEGLGSRLGGLASLAGLETAAQAATPFQLYLESLHSREVADRLAQRPDIMTVVFRGEWDVTSRRWIKPEGARHDLIQFAKRLLGLPRYEWRRPDGARLQEFLKSAIVISRKPTDPIVTLSFDWPDPAFARELLGSAHRVADERLRRQSLRRTDDYIRYLSSKLATVTRAEHQLALAQSLGEQERERMQASSSAPYAAETFGQATSSLRPTRPQPLLVILFGLLGGTVVGVIGALISAYLRRHRALRASDEI